jgi:hypothetical protein
MAAAAPPATRTTGDNCRDDLGSVGLSGTLASLLELPLRALVVLLRLLGRVDPTRDHGLGRLIVRTKRVILTGRRGGLAPGIGGQWRHIALGLVNGNLGHDGTRVCVGRTGCRSRRRPISRHCSLRNGLLLPFYLCFRRVCEVCPTVGAERRTASFNLLPTVPALHCSTNPHAIATTNVRRAVHMVRQGFFYIVAQPPKKAPMPFVRSLLWPLDLNQQKRGWHAMRTSH